MPDIVEIEITKPLPNTGVADTTYKIEGSVKIAEKVGAPPWVYAEARLKSWARPEVFEEVTYIRGFPIPVTGNFSIGWVPKKDGIYEVTVLATPALLPLPVIGVSPTTGRSDMMRVEVAKAPPPVGFSNLEVVDYTSEVKVGEKCYITTRFKYQGAGTTVTLYSAIGNYGMFGFDEIVKGSKEITVPSSEEPTEYEAEVDIPITEAIDPAGSPYDIYAKINGLISPIIEDVITITGVPLIQGEFRNFVITGWSPTPAVLGYGDSLTVTHHFEYKGPRYTMAGIYTAIGTRGAFGFDEILAKSVNLAAFGPDEDWRGYDIDVAIPITEAISLGTDYDLYSKLIGIPGADLFDYKDNIIEITEAPTPPGLQPPKVETLAPTNVIHDGAILNGKLIDTGYWSNVDAYFEWGKTTAYGNKTPKIRMYEGQEGQAFYTEVLHLLEPGTAYHYRAAVEAVGHRSEEVGPGYGADMSFTTEAEVIEGFTMRVINPSPDAVTWAAGFVLGGGRASMRHYDESLDYVWEWTPRPDPAWPSQYLPDTAEDFLIYTRKIDGSPSQSHQIIIRLRVGKNYVYDFAAAEMWDDGKVFPPY